MRVRGEMLRGDCRVSQSSLVELSPSPGLDVTDTSIQRNLRQAISGVLQPCPSAVATYNSESSRTHQRPLEMKMEQIMKKLRVRH